MYTRKIVKIPHRSWPKYSPSLVDAYACIHYAVWRITAVWRIAFSKNLNTYMYIIRQEP